MPSPSSTIYSSRPDLEGAMLETNLAANRAGFIATKVLPVLEVDQKQGVYWQVPIEQLLQDHDTKRAPGSGYQRGDWTFTSGTFFCEERGWEEVIDDGERAAYGSLDIELISAERARDFVLRDMERDVATAVFNAVTWSAQGITHEWDDATNAVPISDVATAKATIRAAIGDEPNALIINKAVYDNLLKVDSITDKIKYHRGGLPGELTPADLSLAFGLPYIIVGSGGYNTKGVGTTVVVGKIWSDEYAMVAKIATSNDPRESCLGRIFHWNGAGSRIGTTIESYRDEARRSDVIRAIMYTDEVILNTSAAVLLDNVTT